MKYLLNLLLFCFILINSFAQKTTIHGKLQSMKGGNLTINRPTKLLIYDNLERVFLKKQIAQNGAFSLNLNSIDKEIILITVWDSIYTKKLFEQYLFISKGDNLFLSEKSGNKIAITGVGANNNQLEGISTYHNIYNIGEVKADSLPDRIYRAIGDYYQNDKILIDAYIATNKPSKEAINAWNYHLKYARLASFNSNYGNKNFRNPILKRNKQSWVSMFNKLQDEVAISDDKALVSPSYHNYLWTFLMRKHEESRHDFDERPAYFYQEWFGGDSLKGKEAMSLDYTNQLKQKIIEKYFTGKVKEHLYAILFYFMIEDQLFFNAKSIFNDFERQFPNSKYNSYFKKPLRDAIARFDNPIPKKTIFLEGNTVAKWDSILRHFKGKAILLDMWGTWCSPCRQEIEKNSAALKRHFEGKGLEFLYVTNYDTNMDKWKQLIAFFNMEGNHIFANEILTDEIMEKVKGSGYPTYAIIDKYGKVELSAAGFPMDRDMLIQQIEGILKR